MSIFYMVKRLWAMRITKLPIPLLIAAAAFTSTVLIYVYLTAPQMPIHTDRNFTNPLFGGMTYLWRGAAFEYIFSADNQITLSYGTPYHLIYLFGPLYNISIVPNRLYIVFGDNVRPLYVFQYTDDGSYGPCLVFKLRDVTPENITIANLTLYLPTVFGVSDTLTEKEHDTITTLMPHCIWYANQLFRVVGVQVNGTHIIFRAMQPTSTTEEVTIVRQLKYKMTGKTIRVLNEPIRNTYAVGDMTFAVMALPYLHFAITPSETTTLAIYVR